MEIGNWCKKNGNDLGKGTRRRQQPCQECLRGSALGRDPEQPWEEDVCGHLGMPELWRCAKRQQVPGMALMGLSSIWDLHKAGWASSELLGHHPPEDVGGTGPWEMWGLLGCGLDLEHLSSCWLCTALSAWVAKPSVLTNLKETSLFSNYLQELPTGEKNRSTTQRHEIISKIHPMVSRGLRGLISPPAALAGTAARPSCSTQDCVCPSG